jgi:protein-tyrosine phosphatase
MTEATILMVCAANICRSPVAAHLLSSTIHARFGPAVRVASAGTRAREGDPACRRVHPSAVGLGWEAFRDAHRAHRLDEGDIDAADLILTASRAERSEVARLRPTARPRTFTLPEAAVLTRSAADAGWEVPETIGQLAQALHSRRGVEDLPPPYVRLRWGRSLRVHPFDVPDAHMGHGVRHDDVIARTLSAIGGFREALDGSLQKE